MHLVRQHHSEKWQLYTPGYNSWMTSGVTPHLYELSGAFIWPNKCISPSQQRKRFRADPERQGPGEHAVDGIT